MVMTGLTVPRNTQSGESLTFVIDLQKVLIDNTVRLNLNTNNPFDKPVDIISREQVAYADKYPSSIQYDSNISLKDQASSSVDAGIQDLLPIPSVLIDRVVSKAALLSIV